MEHPSRVHLDIESDDIPAEVARLEALGARKVAEIRTWVVMEAPTGHRFCVIRAQTPDFERRRRPGPSPGPEALAAAAAARARFGGSGQRGPPQ